MPTEGMDSEAAQLAYRTAVARGFTITITDPDSDKVLDIVQVEHPYAFEFKPNFGADAELIRSVLKVHLVAPKQVVRLTIGLTC